MTAETQRPNGELSDVGLVASDYTDHDEDPDVSSVTIAATDNNTSTEYGVDFPTPTGNPTVGADLQEFRAGVEEFDSGQTGTPQARIELWENGALVRAGTDTNVSTYAVLSFTWNANELATADGSLVQMKVIGTKSGGSPGARNTVNIGHMEWNVDYSGDPVHDQVAFRGRNDDGTLITATNIAAENADFSQATDTAFRIRFQINETAGGATPSTAVELKYSYNSAAYVNITASSSVIKATASGTVTNGAVVSNDYLAASGGTFRSGKFDGADAVVTMFQAGDGVGNDHSEIEYCLTIVDADVSNGDTIDIKIVYNIDNSDFDAYTQLPRVTVSGVTTTPKTIAASGSGAATVTPVIVYARDISSTGAGTATVTKIATYYREVSPTAVGTATVNRIANYLRSISSTALGTATISAGKLLQQSISAAASGVATLSTVTTYVRSVSANAIGTATVNRVASFFRTVGVAATGSATVSRVATFIRSISPSAAGTATIAQGKIILQAISSAVVGTATLSPLQVIGQAISSTAVGAATINRVVTFIRTVSTTAMGAATLSRIATFHRTVSASATGAATFIKLVGKTIAASSIGTATVSAAILSLKTISTVATAVASLAGVFIAGSGASVGYIIALLRRRRR